MATIVIGGVFNTPTQAKFSKWCDEIGRLQDAIMSAHGSRAAQVATDSNFDRIDNSRIYKYIATKNENASVELIRKKEMVMIDKNNNTLNIEIPNYDNQNWYIDLSTGQIYMSPGITYEEAIYMSEEDIKNGGCETRTPIDTTGTISYVGRYADIDGDGNIDGVIYADLLAQKNEHGQWANDSGTFTITTGITSDNVKDYVISKNGAKNSSFDNTSRDVITPAKGTSGEERFYVMSLTDMKNPFDVFLWYKNSGLPTPPYGTLPTNPLLTLDSFGKGRTNTTTMKAICDAGTYGEKDSQDVWQYVTSGWFVPSKEEWAAFASALEITSSNYTDFKLSYFYFSSSQSTEGAAWGIDFGSGSLYNYFFVHYPYSIRLSTTF